MEFYFNLTDEQVDMISNEYPVWFGDDFRGSLEQWLGEWIVGILDYDIKLSENENYRFDVMVNVGGDSHCNAVAMVECSKEVSNFRF